MWGEDADILWGFPMARIYLPPGSVRYRYSVDGQTISGVLNVSDPSAEWYMSIDRSGIFVHQ